MPFLDKRPFSLRIALAAVAFLSVSPLLRAQTSHPKNEPAAMGSDYQPLLWRGTDAKFALDMTHSARCQLEVTEVLAPKISDPDFTHLFAQSTELANRINKRLRSMGKPSGFKFESKKRPEPCTETEHLSTLNVPELRRAYLEFLASTGNENLARFRDEAGAPPNSSNYELRKFAASTLTDLYQQQQNVDELEKKLPTAADR